MKEKCKKICKYIPFEFSFQNYKIIFIIICPIFGVLNHRIRNLYLQESYIHEYFNMFLYFLSYIISSIPLLIYLIANRTNKEQNKPKVEEDTENEELSQNQIINQEIKKRGGGGVIRHILLVVLLFFVGSVRCRFDFTFDVDE